MIALLRGPERFRSEHDGVITRHAFSSGAHYDPANVAFGRLIACDAHEVAPAAGFAAHSHMRVELLSWVVSGALLHTDAAGREHVIGPGQVQYQQAGAGIRHSEVNASSTASLSFVQLWLVSDSDRPDYRLTEPPLDLDAARFEVRGLCDDMVLDGGRAHLYVAAGEYVVGSIRLSVGDSLRTDEAVRVSGAGQLLVLTGC